MHLLPTHMDKSRSNIANKLQAGAQKQERGDPSWQISAPRAASTISHRQSPNEISAADMWILSLLVQAFLAASAYASQPEAAPPVAAPLRKLPWAQLNIIHTTDIHGWLGGHLQEYASSYLLVLHLLTCLQAKLLSRLGRLPFLHTPHASQSRRRRRGRSYCGYR